jgi:hypothetical protein
MLKVWERKRREGTNHLSKEAVERLRLSQIGKHKGELNAMYGRKHSEKTKILMSQKLKLIWSQRKKGWSHRSDGLKNRKPSF